MAETLLTLGIVLTVNLDLLIFPIYYRLGRTIGLNNNWSMFFAWLTFSGTLYWQVQSVSITAIIAGQ